MKARAIVFLTICFVLMFAGCTSQNDLEDAYNQGYYDALDCVRHKGGSAINAADACENE